MRMAHLPTHITQTIHAAPDRVAAFAGEPANLPLWAEGLSAGIRNEDGRWITDSPMGIVEVRFRGEIELGVLDHDVIFPDGSVVHNPFRVLHNDGDAEVVFTLYRQRHMSDEEYERDAALVREDLRRLKDLLEGNA